MRPALPERLNVMKLRTRTQGGGAVVAVLVAMVIALLPLAAGASEHSDSSGEAKHQGKPKVQLELTKVWAGADHGGATVEFFVAGRGPFEPNQPIDVTDLQGQTVGLEERVIGLPDSTTYESDLPSTYRIPEVRKGKKTVLLELTVTNTLTVVEGTSSTTTLPPSTTLPPATTTTTAPAEVLPTVVTTSTMPSEVLPTVVTTTESSVLAEVETLPLTGSRSTGWLVLAAAMSVIGSLLIVTTRHEEDPTTSGPED